MKQYKDKDLPIILLFFSIFTSVLGTAVTDFGKNYRHTAAGESGVILIVFFYLILPIFSKGLRKTFWTKKGILIMLISIIINLPFAIISIKNKGSFFKTQGDDSSVLM